MKFRLPVIRPARGNALAPVAIIVAALTVSALVFFFYTRKQIEQSRAEGSPELAAVDPAVDDGKTTGGPPKVTVEKNAETPGTGKEIPAATAGTAFIRPADLAKELTRLLAAGDLAGAAKIIAPDDATVTGVLEKIFHGLGYKAGSPEQAGVIGQVEDLVRVFVPLVAPDGSTSSPRLLLDLERDPRRGWKVSQVHLPVELESAIAALPAPVPPVGRPAAAGAGTLPSVTTPPGGGRTEKPLFIVDRSPDALSRAGEFVGSLLKLDYQAARACVDPAKVPPVKLAALCIVFEEGKYRLADDRALVATVATDTTSWVITRVSSGVTGETTEFGLEMEKIGTDWRVGGLNLSRLLSDNTRASSQDDVPYSPLVMNPKGGESIALFFELNQAVLHPRARKQLDIVVTILKSSPQRKLKIGGYTDALGSDDYNLNLSRRRAEAVKEYFLTQGVPLAQVETAGFGKSLPLSPNVKPDGSDNPEGRSRNRRAEILLDF